MEAEPVAAPGLATAADLDADDGRVHIIVGGALLTTVFLEDAVSADGRGRAAARPRSRPAAAAAASTSSSDEWSDADAEEAAALRAAGFPTSFAGSGLQPPRRPRPRREGTGMLARFPEGPTGTRTVFEGGGDGKEEGEAAADVDHGASTSAPPSHSRPVGPARKYWAQRYSLWSNYDAGVVMDGVGWFSATPEALALHHAARSPSPALVLDAFAGCGGNAVRFAARAGVAVVAVELDAGRAAATTANATLAGPAAAAALDAVAADFFRVAPRVRADAVFLSPPWGGPAYARGAGPFPLEPDLGGLGAGLASLVAAAAAAHAPGAPLRVAAFLPRHARLDDVVAAAPPGARVEVERAVVGGRLKGVTAYYGAWARGAGW